MAGGTRLNWVRVVVAVVAAEALPVLALVAVVSVYSLTRRADSVSPEEFAPVAGMWVGPIGGFLATLLFALWAAKHSPQRPIVQGASVGLGAALLDFGLGMLLGGGGPIHPVFFLSNGGRILAGVLGGWLASRAGVPTRR
jgi:hypothetical protein